MSAELVRKAREVEIEYVRRMKTYAKVPSAMAHRLTGKPLVKLRWVDTNKGTENDPNVRCRLVGMEFKRDARPEMFAATPPQEAARLIISWVASHQNECLMHIDVSRAYFHAPATRPTFIETAPEDFQEGAE